MFLKIAIGNLLRNNRRTIITEISIIFGVFVIVFAGAITHGMTQNWAATAIESYTGSMQVEHQNYEKERKFKPLETTLSGGQELTDKIKKFPQVTAAFGQLQITGLISNGSKSTTFLGRGVDVLNMKKTLPRLESRIGSGSSLGNNPNEVILGKKLANNLGLELGDSVMLLVRTLKGGLNMVELIMVGTESYAGQNDYIDAHYVEMSLKAAQRLMRMPDKVSQIVVGYENFMKVPESAIALQNLLNETSETKLIVKDYSRLIPGFETTKFFKLIGNVIGFVLFLIVGAGIANAMFMSVMERRKEIGTMKAIGAEQGTIRRLFLLEGFFIAFIGAILGLVISVAIIILIQNIGGISMPPAPGSSESVTINPVISAGTCMYAVVLSLIVALVASYLPAKVSSKLDPIETLREE